MSAAAVTLTVEQQRLVTENINLARSVASTFVRRGMAAVDPAVTSPEDLLSLASVGLVKAARAFDPGRGLRFSTLAVPYIAGELRRYMRDSGHPGGVRYPRKFDFSKRWNMNSLEAPAFADDPEATLHTLLGVTEAAAVEDQVAIRWAVSRLPERLQQVVLMRLGDMTQRQIGDALGVSQAQANRLLAQAFDSLRIVLADGGESLTLTDKQRRILAAMQSLPAGVPVKRISETSGVDVIVADMRPLEVAGLVAEVDRIPIGWRLTPEGEQVAAQIRQAHHPDIKTPEMAAPPPTGSLKERITREMLIEAIRDGRSLGWMSLKFDATPKGIQWLIGEYGIEEELAEEGRARYGKGLVAKEVAKEETELAKNTPGKLTDRIHELYAEFAAGRGVNKASKVELGEQFGCAWTSIQYHYTKWVAQGRPDPRQPAEPELPVAPPEEEAEAAPEADQDIVNAALESMGVETIAGGPCDQVVEGGLSPGEQEVALEVAEEGAALRQEWREQQEGTSQPSDQPATPDQLAALQAHFAGTAPGTAPAKPQPVLPPISAWPREEKPPVEVGDICEGVVDRVENSYTLVNLVEKFEGRRYLRGKIGKFDAPQTPNGDMRDLLREGDLINVKVTRVERRPMGNGWNVSLTVNGVPPHDQEPETLRAVRAPKPQGMQRLPEPAPIVARGSDVAAEEAGAAAPQVAATTTGPVGQEPGGLTELGRAYLEGYASAKGEVLRLFAHTPLQVNQCQTCVKRDVCPIHLGGIFAEPVELADEDKPELLKHMRVTYGRRFVQECSAYHRE